MINRLKDFNFSCDPIIIKLQPPQCLLLIHDDFFIMNAYPNFLIFRSFLFLMKC
jgi:hypothetical protein